MMLVDRSGRVWAMRRDDLSVTQAAGRRAAHFKAAAEGGAGDLAPGVPLEGSDFARVTDGVAVVPVQGPLMRAMSFWFWSYEEIRRDVALALEAETVRAVVLDIDSPGGLSAGVGDLTAWLRARASDGGKPVAAFVGGMGASAAYNIAAACPEIALGSGAVIGSIGTVIEYIDLEPVFEAMGARVVRVVAEQSPNKRLDPESPEGRAEMQALVDAGAAGFVASVAAGRGVSEATVLAAFGQGLVFDGAEAIRRGMADRALTLDDLIAELAGRDGNPGAVPAAAPKETDTMDWTDITAAALRQARPDLVEEIETATRDAAGEEAQTRAAAAAEAERARILAIEEIAVAGHAELVAKAKADGTTTAPELALRILKAERALGQTELADRDADDATAAVPPAPVPGAGETTVSGDAPVKTRAQADWQRDAALRDEFRDFETYLAYHKATARGAARVKGAT